MVTLDSSAQQILLQIAEIASRRQMVKEKCRSIERSDFKCTMHGVARLRTYRNELDQIETELESALKQLDSLTLPGVRSAL